MCKKFKRLETNIFHLKKKFQGIQKLFKSDKNQLTFAFDTQKTFLQTS